jgi:WD40 repeat protein
MEIFLPTFFDRHMQQTAQWTLQDYCSSVQLSPDASTILFHSQSIGVLAVKEQKWQRISHCPYSMDWFPFMSRENDITCCFVASIKDRPVQLFDSNTLRLRYSYITKDQADEICAPLTVKFNVEGSKLYCGFESKLQIFDIQGFMEEEILTSPCRKSKEGLKGLISSIAFNPDRSGIYCLGTFSGQMGLYDERNNEEFCLFRDPVAQSGTFLGVTQVQFSPDGHYLLSCARNSNELLVWDIRGSGEVLHRLYRPGNTTQRIQFDTIEGTVYTGATDGIIRAYDIKTANLKDEWKASESVVAGCSIRDHVLAIGSGQREFRIFDDEETNRDFKLQLWSSPSPKVSSFVL